MKTCLIVDDVTVTRFTARHFIEEIGLNVLEAENQEDAHALLEKDPVDIVLLDLHLKKKSGLDVLAEIREKYRGIPVIIFSGVDGEERAAEVIEAGASEFISKPTTKEKIEAGFRKAGVI